MTSSQPQPDLPAEWVSDKINLDELFKNAKPFGQGDDWECPALFETDEEFEAFQAWLREERKRLV